MKNYVLDTDIGTDNDDAFALIYLLKHTDNLKAVSTAIGDTEIRSKIARKLERMLNKSVPIIIGKTGGKKAEKYWTGIEEKALTEEELKESIEKLPFPEYDENTVLICIAPLTNIAYQILNNPSIRKIKTIYFMGSHKESHNLKVDPEAAKLVFQQPWTIYQITKQDSEKVAFSRKELQQFKSTKLGNFLYDSAIRWLNYSGKKESFMYDVLTVSAALEQGYVKFKKQTDNRFISYDADTKLREKFVETVKG